MVGLFIALQAGGAQADESASARTNTTINNVRTSKDLYAAGDFRQAEKALLASNAQKEGTPEWSLESARLLIFIGFHLKSQGYASLLPTASERAKYYIEEGLKNSSAATSVSTISSLYENAGLISEKIDCDLVAASAYYKAALDANPQAQGAREELDRISILLAKMEARRRSHPQG